jgi:ABC-type lipoprotein export system ATPase subunit
MLLRLKNISKHYKNPVGSVLRKILVDINLELGIREKIAIVGPSGSGKTTLLNIIGTLDTPDSGELFIKDIKYSDYSEKEILKIRNKEIGFIFQLHHLLPQCTLWENVLMPTLPDRHNRAVAIKRAEDLLKKVGIWDMRHQLPGELSGGECQRAAVVRALINKPSLLLADEPTGALDEENALQLMQLLMDLNEQENTSLIVVSHSNKIAQMMDDIYYLRNGQLEIKNKNSGA